MWEEIGDEISIPHQIATGFVVRNTPNTLYLDTDGNGNPDKDIKGLGGLVLLRGKDENGERFDYAVRIRKSGERWDLHPAVSELARLLAKTSQFSIPITTIFGTKSA